MKKIILFILMLTPFCVKAQNPVQVTQPYKFLKWVSVKDSLVSYQTIPQGDSSHFVPNTAWVLRNLGASVIPQNSIISGLTLTLTNDSTVVVSTGTWRINNVVYSKGTTTSFNLIKRDSIFSRYVTFYANTSNQVLSINGVLSPDPVEATLPANTIRIGSALITPTGTTLNQPSPSSNYVYSTPKVKQQAFPVVRALTTDTLKIGTAYKLPSIDGISGQSLVTNGAGTVGWANVVYTNGYGLLLNSNVFSVDTTKISTIVGLVDTINAHSAYLSSDFKVRNDSLFLADTLYGGHTFLFGHSNLIAISGTTDGYHSLFVMTDTSYGLQLTGVAHEAGVGIIKGKVTLGVLRVSDRKTAGVIVDSTGLTEFTSDINGAAPRLHLQYDQTNPNSIITRHVADSLIAAGGGGGGTTTNALTNGWGINSFSFNGGTAGVHVTADTLAGELATQYYASVVVGSDGIVSGMVTTTVTTTATTTAGTYRLNNLLVVKSTSTNTTIPAQDATLNRYTLIVGDASGVLSAVNGVLAVDAVEPDIPANKTLIASIYIPVVGGTVTTTGGGNGKGTVTRVSSSTTDILVANQTTKPVLTLNKVNGFPITYYDPTSSIQTQINGKQATLVSGTNIKTINSVSILGSGNILIGGGAFLPLTFLSDQTINAHNHSLTANFQNGAFGSILYIDSVGFSASTADNSGSSLIGMGSGQADISTGDTLNNYAQISSSSHSFDLQVDTLGVLAYTFHADAITRKAFFADNQNHRGINYKNIDFSKFQDSTLVPKAYVISLIDSIGGGGNTIYTASDSLRSNRQVRSVTYDLEFGDPTQTKTYFEINPSGGIDGTTGAIKPFNGYTSFGFFPSVGYINHVNPSGAGTEFQMGINSGEYDAMTVINYDSLGNEIGFEFVGGPDTSSSHAFAIFHNNMGKRGLQYSDTASYSKMDSMTMVPLAEVWRQVPTKRHVIYTPTTGDTDTVFNNRYTVISGGGSIANLTLVMPSSPHNGDCVYIKIISGVGTLHFDGATFEGDIQDNGWSSNTLLIFVYDEGTNTWY